MFGLYLLYYFRVFETQIGCNKYSAFILFSVVVSSLFEAIALAFFKAESSFFSSRKRSILPAYVVFLPVFSIIRIFSHTTSSSEFVSSFFSRMCWPTLGGSSPSASGRNVIGNIPSYTGREVEASSVNFWGALILWLSAILFCFVGCSSNIAYGKGNYPSAAPIASTVEPSDNSIAMLVSMGFDRNSARQPRNDVSVATNILLEAQSH
ncbi:hypothetical protein IFM89_036968 [Coptis chinensis]|uniref:UBA domain-containing protein n=1 Tax=Coptis chinensis TaxID=261450 RepID=A0A835H972_9MAGN|nr:hypothetical protein IFM89_036968 [Coptis chinensis]